MAQNLDPKVVKDFGKEWRQFDQSAVPREELLAMFNRYFALFPWQALPRNAEGFDLGCGSGRWAMFVAPRVGKLHCIEPSEAIEVAKRNLAGLSNCQFHIATVDTMPLEDESMDFGYALGVLHHLPDPEGGLRRCVAKLKGGAPLLVYLYYAFDNKPKWFRAIWKVSDLARRILARSPYPIKYGVSQLIALFVYLPLARLALLLERLGVKVDNLPLSPYRDNSFYTMRTDALDRFGTRLEHRFTRQEVKQMMERAGLINIQVSDRPPFWCAVGCKR
jgi:SAM-dependent methyltransferase